MDTLKTLVSGTPLDIDKNIDEILSILSKYKKSKKKHSETETKPEQPIETEKDDNDINDILTHDKWEQIFSIAGRKRKFTETSKPLKLIIKNLFGKAKTESLNLSGYAWITDPILKKIGDALEDADTFDGITSVNVDMCKNISFECLLDSVLSKTDNLTHFSCKFCTQFTCSKIEKMCGHPTLLTAVDFSGLSNLSDAFLARFFFVFPSVKVLKLNYVSNLTANVFKVASEKLPSLNTLEVSFCEPQILVE